MATWHASEPFRDKLIGIGLDSSELGYPPELFADVYELARQAGLHVVAHAGEEGPPQYIADAIELLEVERIDHGVRSDEDPGLVAMLVRDQIPLTMCPLSNVKLSVFDRIENHNLKRLLDLGVKVTVNSDDPAYFEGYVLDNYLAVAEGLGLSREDLVQLARNSIEAAFIPDEDRALLIEELEAVASE
jgi:adenosine deaminase